MIQIWYEMHKTKRDGEMYEKANMEDINCRIYVVGIWLLTILSTFLYVSNISLNKCWGKMVAWLCLDAGMLAPKSTELWKVRME